MPRLSPPIVLVLLLLPASWLSTAAGQGLHASGIELYSRSRRDAGAGGVYEYKAPRYTEAASWGYVEVRPLAHMFWWLQPYKQQPLGDAATGTPLIIWLQGGPGASGTGFGQFTEVGPVDMDDKWREFAWTERAHVLFVDNPVGTGFSYVEEGGTFATDNSQIGADLAALLMGVLDAEPGLAGADITIVCESYGGKMGVALAKELLGPKGDKKHKVNLKGLALGDSWISPVSFVLAWGPLLNDFSLLDSNDYETIAEAALDIQSSISRKEYPEASDGWAQLETLVEGLTDNVNFYNLLQHNVPDIGAAGVPPALLQQWRSGGLMEGGGGAFAARVERHLAAYHNQGLSEFMNGEVKEALGSVIPAGVIWGGQAGEVFKKLKDDFMKNVTTDVDHLLDAGLNVTVYNGQLDLICCTRGTELWLKSLKWGGAKKFGTATRMPLYVGTPGSNTGAFYKSYQNLAIFYIMNAGHMVPSDTPEMALSMLDMILS
eukprot:jgi/Tetstr1/446446/TSEL_033988.t1